MKQFNTVIIFGMLLLAFGASAGRAPRGADTAVALTTLRTLDCKKMDEAALRRALRQASGSLSEECNFLQEKKEMDKSRQCNTELEKISALSRKCDAPAAKDIATKISNLLK
jgi:hypothetical protein